MTVRLFHEYQNLMGWLSIKFITEKQRFQVHAFVILNILLF